MNNPTFLFASLSAIAAENPAGFTVSFDNLQPVRTGYAVAVSETQNAHGAEGLARVIDYVMDNAPRVNAFGGWLDSETGLFYWDATIVCETDEEAVKLADRLGF